MLHYYKCVDCLSIATATEYEPRAVCGICDGKLEYMGHVQADRLVETGERCKCDGRCVFASGPNCDCHCGGANHGHGWFGGGFEIVTTDRGPIPCLRMPDNAKAATIAAEWRAAYRAACAAADTADKAGDWRRRYLIGDAANWAKRSRNHKNRMARLAGVLPELAAAATRDVLLF